MEWIGQFSLILHIAFAAIWFGGGIRLAGQVRKAASDTSGDVQALVRDIDGTRRLILWAVGGTLVFSLLVFFMYGGFASYGPRYHASLGLVLVMAAIELVLTQPAWTSIRDVRLADTETDVSSKTGRVAMFVGINHLLWIVVLALMVWRL
jgi:hypothetical protein